MGWNGVVDEIGYLRADDVVEEASATMSSPGFGQNGVRHKQISLIQMVKNESANENDLKD